MPTLDQQRKLLGQFKSTFPDYFHGDSSYIVQIDHTTTFVLRMNCTLHDLTDDIQPIAQKFQIRTKQRDNFRAEVGRRAGSYIHFTVPNQNISSLTQHLSTLQQKAEGKLKDAAVQVSPPQEPRAQQSPRRKLSGG